MKERWAVAPSQALNTSASLSPAGHIAESRDRKLHRSIKENKKAKSCFMDISKKTLKAQGNALQWLESDYDLLGRQHQHLEGGTLRGKCISTSDNCCDQHAQPLPPADSERDMGSVRVHLDFQLARFGLIHSSVWEGVSREVWGEKTYAEHGKPH